ncbi:hypothetical protein BHM03_00050574, partial [Ensete ventricosum]
MRGEYTSARPIRDPEQSSSISELLHSRRPPPFGTPAAAFDDVAEDFPPLLAAAFFLL